VLVLCLHAIQGPAAACQALAEARRVPGAAEAAGGEIDVTAVLRRRDEVVHDLSDDAQMPWIEKHSIELVRGHGTVAGEREIHVGEDVLRARKAVILAPGTGATIPPIPGLRESHAWTNREVTTAKAIPASLLVLGGGVVGVEMATAYASLGAKVTIVEALPRLISSEDSCAGRQVKDALEALDVEVVLGVKATAVQRAHEKGSVTLELEDGRSFTGDELLCAIGRTPHTDGLWPGGARLDEVGPARPVDRGGRHDARARPRVAIRGRRRQRPRAAHTHGQVSGAPRPRTTSSDARVRQQSYARTDGYRHA